MNYQLFLLLLSSFLPLEIKAFNLYMCACGWLCVCALFFELYILFSAFIIQ